ncbi:hypothetical protein SK3146_02053 [Paenibacillus konkukensis]|uniref:Uncharacterized protein n=1 Tax=Paenibacillus konkukensis TaxID=2020716 RepID=A0ABY4RL94_9BACL|nr:hypothetical protein SK3146_02053 [Paenibacillus konkukensis]
MQHLNMILIYLFYWPSALLLCLTSFRFKIRYYTRQIVLSTLVMTQCSVLLQSFKAEFLMSLIHPICLLMCIVFFFRLRFAHSLLIAAITFCFNIVLESTLNFFLANFDYIKFVEISRNDYMIQGFILAFTNYVLAFLLHKLRVGFSFISSNHTNYKVEAFPRKLIFTTVAGCIIMTFTSFSIYFFAKLIMLIISITFFVLIGIVNLSHEKELAD